MNIRGVIRIAQVVFATGSHKGENLEKLPNLLSPLTPCNRL
jgi:hypothetical protein